MILRPTIYWINGPWSGRLGIAARPRGGDWLEDEARALRNEGVDGVVSTLETQESRELELQHEQRAIEGVGIDFVNIPIADRTVPKRDFLDALSDLDRQLHDGKRIVVHCRQGIGRSAVVASALLVLAGIDADRAIQLVKEARQVNVPETEEQKEWIYRFARNLVKP